MAVSRGGERINPIAEVAAKFNTVWFAAKYADIGFASYMIDGVNVAIDLERSVIELGFSNSETRTTVNFSKRRGDLSVVGLTVSERGGSRYVSQTVLRERSTGGSGDFPSHEFIWTGAQEDAARLVEARVHFGPTESVRYARDLRWNISSDAPWERVWQGSPTRRLKVFSNPNIDDSMPPSLEGAATLWGKDIPWEIDPSKKAEEILHQSRIRSVSRLPVIL